MPWRNLTTLDNSGKLKPGHHTLKRFVANSENARVRSDIFTTGMFVSARQKHCIKRAAAKMPLQGSKQIFEAAGASVVLPTSRCRILRRLTGV